MKIPKKIRNEIEEGLLEHLKSIELNINKPAFKFNSELIKLRYLSFSKAGDKFIRRINFKFKRIRSLDSFPIRNLGFFDEVFKIQVILDNNKRITSSSYPNKKPNFKLPKFVKKSLNNIILEYIKTVNWKEEYIINSPIFNYFKNKIVIRYFDGKFVERKMKFWFIKSNQKVLEPNPKLERTVQLIVDVYGLLRNELTYYKRS